MKDIEFDELLGTYISENNLYRLEGRTGFENLCKIVGAIGYRDPLDFGQLNNGCCVGDLICFFEDNPGAVEAVIDFIMEWGENVPDWKAELQSNVVEDFDDEEEE